jgi:hypothetical protein
MSTVSTVARCVNTQILYSYSRLPIRYEIDSSKGIVKGPALNGVSHEIVSGSDSENDEDPVFEKGNPLR